MTSQDHGVWKAIVIQAGGISVCAAVSFLLMIVLARELGTELFGRYVLVLTVATIVLVVIEGGWSNEVYRRTAAAGAERQLSEAAVRYAVAHIALAGVGLSLLAASIGLWLFPFFTELAVALVCMTGVAAMNLVSSAMRGSGRFALEALFQTAGRLVSAALIVLVLIALTDAWIGWYFIAWAIGLFLMLLPALRCWLSWPDVIGWTGNVRRVMPLMLYAGAMVALFKIDVIVLGAMQVPDTALSNYAATTRFIEAGMLLFAAVSNVLLRQFSLHVQEPQRLLRQVRYWFLFALLSGALIVGAAFWSGSALVLFAFGETYKSAAEIVVWVSLVFPFAFANLVLMQGWIALEMDSRLVACLCVAIALLCTLVVIGWSVFQLVGVAAGVAVTQLLLTLMLYSGLSRDTRAPS